MSIGGPRAQQKRNSPALRPAGKCNSRPDTAVDVIKTDVGREICDESAPERLFTRWGETLNAPLYRVRTYSQPSGGATGELRACPAPSGPVRGCGGRPGVDNTRGPGFLGGPPSFASRFSLTPRFGARFGTRFGARPKRVRTCPGHEKKPQDGGALLRAEPLVCKPRLRKGVNPFRTCWLRAFRSRHNLEQRRAACSLFQRAALLVRSATEVAISREPCHRDDLGRRLDNGMIIMPAANLLSCPAGGSR